MEPVKYNVQHPSFCQNVYKTEEYINLTVQVAISCYRYVFNIQANFITTKFETTKKKAY